MKTIYGLREAGGPIRYVGQTKLPLKERLQLWRSNSRSEWRCAPVFHWVREALRRGAILEITALEEAVDYDAAERKWIAALPGLLNVGRGGPGCPGVIPDDATRQRRAASVRASWQRETKRVRWVPTTEQLAKQRANLPRGDTHPKPMLGKKHSEATKAKMRAWWAEHPDWRRHG